MTTVELILDLISKKGIEQQQFAKDIGVTKQTISEWKSGKTQSYKKHISRIAEYFNVSTDYLLGNEPKEKSLSEKDRLIADIVNVLYSKTDDELIALRDMLVKFAQSKGK